MLKVKLKTNPLNKKKDVNKPELIRQIRDLDHKTRKPHWKEIKNNYEFVFPKQLNVEG